MTYQEISDRIREIEWVLEHEPDLSQNRVMALGGEGAGLFKSQANNKQWLMDAVDEGMWAILHRLRGI